MEGRIILRQFLCRRNAAKVTTMAPSA